jgi:hypothetical protein
MMQATQPLNHALSQAPQAGHPSLSKLEALCDDFDRICQSASRQTQPDEMFLADTDDELWALARNMVVEIALLEGEPTFQDTLRDFQRHHFQAKVLKWYWMNPEIKRLWTKPAGYSGDYHTVELLCQQECPLTRFEDIFLNHLLRSDMASQHWNKVLAHTKFLLRVLEKSNNNPIRILDAGCGPSHDVREATRWLQHDCVGEIVLVDLDPQALRFSRSKLRNARHGIQFTYMQGDVLKTVRKFLQQGEAGTFDAILFGGLFDYISDRILRLLLKQSRHLLKGNGEMLFSQVSKFNPDRTFMKWFGDWQLIERDEEDLLNLCRDAEIAEEQVFMWRERSKCAILCHVANHGTPQHHGQVG